MRIMVVGAAGVFGSRLVEQLVAAGFSDLILAGREMARAQALLASLRGRGLAPRFQVFDRRWPDAAVLRALAPNVLIDAAGPFQGSDFALPESCIAAGVHYIDLADARDFVARIVTLDDKARAASVVVIAGASSTPALSHAVIDHLTKGWRRIDRVFAAISPGNRVPRGLSLVEAILSYAGKPLAVFREGRWTEARGWSGNETIQIAGIGARPVALCETPDLDLFVARYRPRIAAEFKAGLEHGILHGGMRLLAALAAMGLAPPPRRLARPLRALAVLLERFGSDVGGMLVRVSGRDADDRPCRMSWSLVARSGIGPNVPTLPAVALVESLARGEIAAGARAAAGVVGYDRILNHLNRLGIETHVTREDLGAPFVFERALGRSWAALPEITRRVHTPDPSIVLEGEATVQGAETAAGRLFAKAFGFPEQAEKVPVRVVIENDGAGERWARHYPTRTMRSTMTAADASVGTIEERIGPLRFRLRLDGSERGIDLVPVGVAFHGLPLPHWLLPKIAATETASEDGRHLFDVHVSLRPFGRLVHYRGWLRPA
jgi:hypothetical protein